MNNAEDEIPLPSVGILSEAETARQLHADRHRKSWRCFHCDEVFTDRAAALEHFGSSTLDEPACQTDAARLRTLEKELRRYRDEDTDLHRQVEHLTTEHQTALRREEEMGYARGLRDGQELAKQTGQTTHFAQ